MPQVKKERFLKLALAFEAWLRREKSKPCEGEEREGAGKFTRGLGEVVPDTLARPMLSVAMSQAELPCL